MPGSDPLHRLKDCAESYGIALSEGQTELFRIYLDELVLWNRHMNLTGLSSREGIVIELFLDSLIPVPLLPEEGTLLDVGSGAGVPGLPIKICRPQLEVSLLEPRAKRVSFLRQVVRLLGLRGIQVIRGRMEEGGGDATPWRHHVITARALAPLSQTLSRCARLVLPEGLLICFLGSRADALLKECSAEVERQGMVLLRTIPYSLPGKKGQRNVVLFKKTAAFPEGRSGGRSRG